MQILPNTAPIIVTWIPKDTGKTLPDGKNSKFNYVDVLIKHKQKTNEERDIFLVVNGSGFKSGQIEELRDRFKEVKGVYVIDLHDPKYNPCWKEVDQGWKINGKDMSIQDYFYDMYNKKPEERTSFAIEIDTFRYIAAYCMLCRQKESKIEEGIIYIDFDALDSISNDKYIEQRKKLYNRDNEQKGIGSDITIPDGILVSKDNNDIIAVTDLLILQKICDQYKQNILSQDRIKTKFEEKLGKERIEEILQAKPGKDIMCAIFYSKPEKSYFFEQNIAQLAFNHELRDMAQSYDVNFIENGGEYLDQAEKIDNQRVGHNDVSWCKDLYI
ncbi:hypothetical protein [Wolbachia endosymbiont (group B) of Hofmannophila pseudospretella]|uniref:hypothetical protein n=1 Tax=Wolbachia endosymbiont (group B) of Hofmannophila pseudospretella TaxID=3066177 RepID=UPI0033400987